MTTKKAIPLLICLFLSFFILTTVKAYEVPYYTTNTSSSIFYVYQPSLKPDATTTCISILNSKTTLTSSGTFDVLWNYYSDYFNLIATGSLIGVTNLSCRDLGTINSTDTSSTGLYESTIKETQSSSVGGFGWLNTNFLCSSSENKVNFHVLRSDSDSLNLLPMYLYEYSAGIQLESTMINGYGSCSQTYGGQVTIPTKIDICTTDCTITYVIPINSSESGLVNITAWITNNTAIWASNQGTIKAYNITLVKMSDNSQTSLYAMTDTSLNINLNTIVSANLTLASNELYLLVFNAINDQSGVGNTTMTIRPPNEVNITIDARIANWSCGAYSECQNGSQTRTCIDLTSQFPQRIESKSCFPTAFEQQNIGFEQYNETTVYECKKDAWSCVSTPQPQAIKIPYGWIVGFATRNLSGNEIYIPKFIDMLLPTKDNNSIDAVEGTLVLAMYYDPPSVDDVLQDTNTTIACGNQSVGRIPTVRKDLNQTVFTDITFPSPYSTLSWYARKFEEPVIQYQVWTPYCYPYNELCYAPNCTSSMLGSYKVGLYTLTNGTISGIVNEYFGNANSNWGQVIWDMSNFGLLTNTTYRLVFSVIPPNTDTFRLDGVGVYFDNIVVSNLPVAIAQCQQFCNGTDLFVPRTSNGSCIFEIQINNSYCRGLIQAEQIANQTQGIFQPQGIFNTTAQSLENAGFANAGFFFSPFFLATLVLFIIGIVVEILVKSSGKSFGMIMIIGIVGFTAGGVYPIWVGIVTVVLVALYVARFVMTHLQGQS